MIKKLLILLLLVFSISSCAGIAGGMIAGANSKGSYGNIFESQYCAKYKCKKVGECIENPECNTEIKE